jgi:site-specific recombinase XerD
VDGSWWVTIPKSETKTKSPEERRVPERFNAVIASYLGQARPVLMKPGMPSNALWTLARTGMKFTTKNLGTLISKITFQTLGVDVSPHLFRTAAATTSALYASDSPHLASGVLGHRDWRVTQEHYIRATSLDAAKAYADIIREYRTG